MQHHESTPIYRPTFHEALSPSHLWAKEIKKEPEKIVIPEKPDASYEEMNREAYKNLSDDEKNLICAGLVCSGAWRRFLKPYLEEFSNPVRRKIRSEADQYQLMNDNAVAAFCNELISNLESRAFRSPSYTHPTNVIEESTHE